MTKSNPLTTNSPLDNSGYTLNAIALSIMLSIFGTGLLTAIFPGIATAEDTQSKSIAEELPPPPPLSPPKQIVKHKHQPILPINTEPPTYRKNQPREYTFEAPDNNLVNSVSDKTISKYRVEVFANAEEVLKQVKDIEPKAFQQGDIIQVGIFSRQQNAEALVRKLAKQGLWARIKTSK